MVALCQACTLNVPTIGTLSGSENDPIGVCGTCNCLTCGHHGHRDRAAVFVCIQCDSNLQASSAMYRSWRRDPTPHQMPLGAALSDNPPTGLAAELRALFATAGDDLMLVTSVEEWAARRPHYGPLIELLNGHLDNLVSWIDQMITNLEPRVAADLPPDPSASAGEVSLRRLLRELATLWRRMDAQARRLLAASLLIVQIMQLPPTSLPPALRQIAGILDIPMAYHYPAERQPIGQADVNYR